jgi:hypothetical protein
VCLIREIPRKESLSAYDRRSGLNEEDSYPETGCSILAGGNQQTVAGTGALAPLWAGLIVLLNASLGKPVGFLQPPCHRVQARSFRMSVVSDN